MSLRNDPAFQQGRAKAATGGGLELSGGWLKAKVRDMLEVPFTLHDFKFVRKDTFFLPSGDEVKEHDEVQMAIEFVDNAETLAVINNLPQNSMFPVVSLGEVYGISASGRQIIEILRFYDRKKLPLADICFREDYTKPEFRGYRQLYIDDFHAKDLPPDPEAEASPFDQDGPAELILEDPTPSLIGPEENPRSSAPSQSTGRGTVNGGRQQVQRASRPNTEATEAPSSTQSGTRTPNRGR